MEIILKIFILYIVVGSDLNIAEYANTDSVMDCVSQSLTSESTWACGYCLDLDEKGEERMAIGLKMENESVCDRQSGRGELYVIICKAQREREKDTHISGLWLFTVVCSLFSS